MNKGEIPTPSSDIKPLVANELRTQLRAVLKRQLRDFVLASPQAATYTAFTGEDFKEVVLGMVPEIVDEIRRELCHR
jgi:hypothetical protein